MKSLFFILVFFSFLILASLTAHSRGDAQRISFSFLGDTIELAVDESVGVAFDVPLSEQSIKSFYEAINKSHYRPIVDWLLAYKAKNELNDWLYYQLIRKTAQQLSPKAANYPRYTLYKWFLLAKSGYDASLALSNNRLLFYVRSGDNIYDIPLYLQNGFQYVCLNVHDYGKIDLDKDKIDAINIRIPEAQQSFSYKVTQMPDLRDDQYLQKDIRFEYRQKMYHFKVLLNTEVQNIFANYPEVDFESYFNIPISRVTYRSLIPFLKVSVAGMSRKKGIDYLMHFTREAFLYKDDQVNFGKEKRLSPEQTLLYSYSDCDDRAALFFYLVKEIYNLPMIVLVYPTHVTIAVKFDKPVGSPVKYKGSKYSICEPTPQGEDLRLGQLPSQFRRHPFKVAYEYNPQNR